MIPALHVAKFLTWMTSSNNKFHRLFRCHDSGTSDLHNRMPFHFPNRVVILPSPSFDIFVCCSPHLFIASWKQGKQIILISMLQSFYTSGSLPLCFWFSSCDVFLDTLVPLKLEAKWVDAQTESAVSSEGASQFCLLYFPFCYVHLKSAHPPMQVTDATRYLDYSILLEEEMPKCCDNVNHLSRYLQKFNSSCCLPSTNCTQIL